VRLFELKPKSEKVPESLTIAAGDVLRFAASGGQVLNGTTVEALGAFVRGIIGTGGQPVSPAGTPNIVLFRAVTPGTATIKVVYGDPFGDLLATRKSVKIVVTVEE
jgi:hypothetical protein